ncbi:MAG: DUF4230 domain-containing protein [Candidatus Omnitrophica bacterium]|nr:DUF4230 domain-containing protein [Candidatus Omnitrophota bacterium]
MINFLVPLTIGFILALGLSVFYIKIKSRLTKKKIKLNSNIFTSIEKLRSVGELVVFKVITKEIVTADEHWFGEWGKKYLQWMVSAKKMAMIFEFSIDFRYDLRSPHFIIKNIGDKNYRLLMPKCFYETHIRDIHFYDEQSTKLLPWLLPDLINRAFGMNFKEGDKNRLKEEAKQQASLLAKDLVQKMRSEVQTSARQTIEVLAKSFGAEKVLIDFENAELIPKEAELKK